MSSKIFVEVLAKFDTAGQMTPVTLIWQDGRRFDIDKVLNVCRAASLKAGGQGQRYTCKICGKEVYLFYEVDRWFMEGQ